MPMVHDVPRTRRRLATAVLAAVLALPVAACSGVDRDTSPAPLQLWTHGGSDGEQDALRSLVAQWERETGHEVEVTVVDEGDYVDQVQAAAAAGTLPDVLDLDGPYTAALAYRGDLLDLQPLLPSATVDDLLPSLRAQGGYDDGLYSVGAFDSGLALFADARALRDAGTRVPTGPDDAWSAQETTAALQALAARDDDGRVLDLKLGYGTGEWFMFAFAPLVASAGGSLLDPRTGLASGRMDSPAAVDALEQLRAWSPYTDPDPAGDAFVERRVALSWVGHWAYADYEAALGDDLVLLPLPDLGTGSRSGLGSWAWTVPSATRDVEQAVDLVDHLVSPQAVRTMTAANHAVPGRLSVLRGSPAYAPGGPLHLYAEQLTRACAADGDPADPTETACGATPRPVTPAYPVVTAAFARAVADVVVEGRPAREALAAAARQVDDDARLTGYVLPGG